MTKQEFLDELALRLREEGAERLVAENVEYYRGYIEGEVAKGRREEEVLSELGNPALIARSILDAAGYRVDGVPDRNPDGDLGEDAGSYYRTQSEEREDREDREDRNIHVEVRQVNSWIAGILFLLFVVLLVLAVLGFIIWAAPVILALLLLSFMYRALISFFQR